MTATPVFFGSMKNCAAQIQNSDGTALVTILTPGSSGARLKSLGITSDDSSDKTIQLWVTKGAVDYLLGELVVPDGSGSNGTDPALAVLAPSVIPMLQGDGVNYFLELESGAVLKVKCKTSVTAAKKLQIFGEYGEP